MLGAIEGGDLRVEFFRSADRVAHRVLLRGVMIAHSVEGTPEQDWPPSPPFQEVHFETSPQGVPLALLVGQAGRSHWSASVSAGEGSQIVFDVACRLHLMPDCLGTAYQLAATCARTTDSVQIESTGGRCQLLTDSRLELQGCDVQIAPLSQSESLPQTVRWTYRFDALPQPAR